MKRIGEVMDGNTEALQAMFDQITANISNHKCAQCARVSGDIYPGGVCRECHDTACRTRDVAQAMLQLPVVFRFKRVSEVDNIGNTAQVKSTLEQAGRQRHGVYLQGGVGSGKTSLMAAFFCSLAWRGVPVRWIRWLDLISSVRNTYAAGSQTSGDSILSVLANFSKIGVLMVDDVGAENTTDWVRQAFFDLVDRVYGSGGCLWLTSNLMFGEMAARYQNPHGDPISSRLSQMCHVVHLDAPDQRLARKNETLR